MYTALKLGDSANKELQRRIVTVQFDDGAGHVFVKDFSFSLTTELEAMKKAVKYYLDEINLVPPVIDDLIPDPDPVPPAPTAGEIAQAAWVVDWKNLQNAVKLEAHGVSVLSPAQMTALKTKVKDNFLNAYKDLV